MKLRQILLNLSLFVVIVASAGCDVINPEEDLPSYLRVEDFLVGENTDIEEFGKGAKIVAANVIVNNSTVGVVPVPGVIPVFAEGTVEVKLDPLVQENGSSEILQIYPFWERVTMTAVLTKLDTVSLTPETKYLTACVIEGTNFSNANTFFTEDLDNDPQTKIEIVPGGGQAGQGDAGKIVIGNDHPIFEAATGLTFVPGDYTRLWLEAQYKTDVGLLFGIKDVTAPGSPVYKEFGVIAKDEWNTIYFDVQTFLLNQGITDFQLTLSAETNISNAEILLDNIKLVYL